MFLFLAENMEHRHVPRFENIRNIHVLDSETFTFSSYKILTPQILFFIGNMAAKV